MTYTPDHIRKADAEIAAAGHNMPPEPTLLPADALLGRFNDQYAGLSREVTDLLADIRASAPEAVETEQDNGIIAQFMERLRATIKNADGSRIKEKAPYLASERAIDQHFGGFVDRLTKARNILQGRGDAYTARLVAEERARRQREAVAAQAEARRIAEEAAKAAREAAEAEAKANRARNEERIAELSTLAETKIGAAAVAEIDAMVAQSEAENTMIAALAPSADIARTRHETGHLSTAQQVPYVEIEDSELLDMKALWPFIKEEEKLRALKAWAKTTGHKRSMAGAIIEFRDRAAYR